MAQLTRVEVRVQRRLLKRNREREREMETGLTLIIKSIYYSFCAGSRGDSDA